MRRENFYSEEEIEKAKSGKLIECPFCGKKTLKLRAGGDPLMFAAVGNNLRCSNCDFSLDFNNLDESKITLANDYKMAMKEEIADSWPEFLELRRDINRCKKVLRKKKGNSHQS
jgi:transcription elongation factor Elf1